MAEEGKKLKKCKDCNVEFPGLMALTRHRTLAHGAETHQCPVCNRIFTTALRLENHRKAAADETPEGTVPCRFCSKSFPSVKLRSKHEGYHKSVGEWRCPIEGCGKWYNLKKSLDRHIAKHSEKLPFQCPSCVKAFTMKSGLDKHFRKFHSVTPENADDANNKPFPCKLCNHRFISAYTLSIHHKRYHTDEGRYENRAIRCALCDFRALTPSTMANHAQTVHNLVFDAIPVNEEEEETGSYDFEDVKVTKE